MGSANNTFKRKEKKYLLSGEKYRQLRAALSEYIVPDEYPHSTVCSIYYDTPDFRLIRTSNEKPLYKEKLRIRSYNVPGEDSDVFIEIKKKYKGVVYKRRVSVPLKNAESFLNEGRPLDFSWLEKSKDENGRVDEIKLKKDKQIVNELEYFLKFYQNLRPAMFMSYERDSFYAKEDHDLRITFDSDITYRRDNLMLRKGIFGKKLIGENQYLMEIKIPGAMPLWLSHILDDLEIHNGSFTKYGNAYKQDVTGAVRMEGVYINA